MAWSKFAFGTAWLLFKLNFKKRCLNPIRSRGGQYCPPDFLQPLQQKLEEPVTWIFLTFPKYAYTLISKKETIVLWTLTSMLRGVSNRPVKIFCAYFRHIYIFYGVLLPFFHVRCLNILKFGNRYKFWCILTDMLFSRSNLTGHFISPVIVRRSARAWFQMFEWIRQILGGQYCPPPWTWR